MRERVAVSLFVLLVLAAMAGRPAAAAEGAWRKIAEANGTGTTICNTAGDLYSCLALRCGAGRGTELAFLFNVGDYGSAPTGRFSVDGRPVAEIGFSAVDPERELVAAYDPDRHGALIEWMKAGLELTLDIGHTHRFSLRRSKVEIDRTLATCAEEIGAGRQMAGGSAAQSPQDLHTSLRQIISGYRPTDSHYDYREDLARSLARDILAPPSFGNVDISGFEAIEQPARQSSTTDINHLIGGATYLWPSIKFVASREHRAALDDYQNSLKGGWRLEDADLARLSRRFDDLLHQTQSRFGADHPAVAFVLDSTTRLHDARRHRGGDPEDSGLALAELYATAAALLTNASLDSARERDIIETYIAWQLAFAREARGADESMVCGAGVEPREVYEAYRRSAALHHAAFGPALEQIGWLYAAAPCAEDAEQLSDLMRVRLHLARQLNHPQAIARTLADLAMAQFVAGDRNDSIRSFKEAYRVHGSALATQDRGVIFLPETTPGDDSIKVWQVLQALDLEDELDLYLASTIRQVADTEEFARTTVAWGAAYVYSGLLEETGRTDLADQFYRYIGCTGLSIGIDGRRRDVTPSALKCMSQFGEARTNAEDYDGAIRVLSRGLKMAEDRGDRENTAIFLSQLARAHDERGDLDTGLAYARRGLSVARTGDVDLHSSWLDALNQIVENADLEQGGRDNVAESLANELLHGVVAVCERGEEPSKFSAIRSDVILRDPIIASEFIAHPAIRSFIDCFNEKRDVLAATSTWNSNSQFDSHAMSDVLLVLGMLDDKDRADEILEFLFDSNSAIAPGLGAYNAAVQGLLLAKKGEWLKPYLGRLSRSISDESIRRYAAEYVPPELLDLGMGLYALGEREFAERLYGWLAPKYQDEERASCNLQECEFLGAMSEALDSGKDAEKYYDRIGSSFISMNSGASVSPDEADRLREMAIWEGFLHERAGRYRLAEIYYETAESGIEMIPRNKAPLATLTDIQLAASMSRVKFLQGKTQQARDITGGVAAAARDRLDEGAAYSSDAIVRWSHRLRDVFEVHLDSAPAEADGTVRAEESDFFAMQYLQTTNTAATIAKIAERAAATSGDAVRRHQDVSRRLSDLFSQLAVATGEKAAALLPRIDELESEKSAIETQLRVEDPDYAERLGFRFPRLADVQAKLDGREALLLSFSGREHAYLWLVRPDSSTLRRLAMSPAQAEAGIVALRDAVAAYLRSSEDGQWDLGAFHAPYRAFISPFEPMLGDVDRLYFVPNGVFDGLPLSALLQREPPKERMTLQEMRQAHLPWLIRRHAINVLPSVQSLDTLRQPAAARQEARRPFLGIGNPDYGTGIRVAALPGRAVSGQRVSVPALPETAAEVSRIAAIVEADPDEDLLLGSRASELSVRQSDLARYRIINFATHAILAGQIGGVDEPALILAVPDTVSATDDGLLKASEIASLRLDADLVILSACNTAASDGRPGAEGLSGLANAFFYAGARNLVVTHWEIPSEPAVEIATGMIEAYAQSRQTDWSGALQTSIIAMMDGDGPPEFAHPGAWGAHMVVGAAAQ